MKNLLVSALLISFPSWAQAGALVSNNTGIPGTAFRFIDNPAAVPVLTEPSGTDGPGNSFGVDGLWAADGTVSYSATDLPAGSYRLYATWYSNAADLAVGIDLTANGVPIGSVVQGTSPASPPAETSPSDLTGFTAYDPEAGEGSGDARTFQYIGDAVVAADGLLTVVLTKTPTAAYARFDAIAFAPSPGPDGDGDGMPDAWEAANGFDPGLDDSQADRDGDGLRNLDEYLRGTQPGTADSDGDGVPDGDEVDLFATDPLLADSDGDGLTDGEEVNGEFPSNPLDADTDDDGLSDQVEIDKGSDPADPNDPSYYSLEAGGIDYRVVDNSGGSTLRGYEEPTSFGGLDTGVADSWEGDRRWGDTGAGVSPQARYFFTGLPADTYEVFASWRNAPQGNLSAAAIYTVSDGLGAVTINQQIGADAVVAAGAAGLTLPDPAGRSITFIRLGQVTVSDGELTVQLDDDGLEGGTYIFADAIAIRKAQPAPVAFNITSIVRDTPAGQVSLSWQSEAGIVYAVEFSTNLATGSWTDIASSLTASGGSTSYIDPIATRFSPAPVPPQGFYRVRRVSP